jgi:hypothetical protein
MEIDGRRRLEVTRDDVVDTNGRTHQKADGAAAALLQRELFLAARTPTTASDCSTRSLIDCGARL